MSNPMSNTLFVRNISEGTNKEEIAEIFGEVGPVKHAFVVVEKHGENKGKSKGFGFVEFAIEDDAAEAIKQVQGKVVNGKPLRLEYAVAKGTKPEIGTRDDSNLDRRKRQRPVDTGAADVAGLDTDDADKIATKDKGKKKKKQKIGNGGEKESLLNSTVIVFQIPQESTKDQVMKRAKRAGKVASLEYPFDFSKFIGLPESKLSSLYSGGTKAVAKVVYTKPLVATQAVNKLSSSAFGKEKLQVRKLKQIATNPKSRGGCRLIVRNLAFKANVKDVEAKCRSVGPLASVEMPMGSDKRHKGFAFVQFLCKHDAQNVVSNLNGTTIADRGVAVDFALDKSKYEKLLTRQAAEPEESAEVEDDVEATHADESGDDDNTQQKNGDTKSDEEDNVSNSSDDEGEDTDNEHESTEVREQGDDEESQKPQSNFDEEKDCSLFLRNVLFETTENDIYQCFKEFGGVMYAKVVRDRDTNRSRGTAFVRFYKKESASRALEAAATRAERRGDSKDAKAGTTVVEEGGDGIMLGGRPILVTRAVPREDAKQLAEAAADRTKSDKRHLYLAREGNVHANPDTAANLPKVDLRKRENAEKDKKTKLRSPLFFVSPTRLSIRNLSRVEGEMSDAKLRKLFMDAAIEGVNDTAIVGANEGDKRLFPALWPNREKIGPPEIVTAKVVTEKSPEIDPSNNRGGGPKFGRSKGYGFVAFTEHVHALAALRILNNNPKYAWAAAGGPKAMKMPEAERSRLIVEFAVENTAKIKLHEKRLEDLRRRSSLNKVAHAHQRAVGKARIGDNRQQPQIGGASHGNKQVGSKRKNRDDDTRNNEKPNDATAKKHKSAKKSGNKNKKIENVPAMAASDKKFKGEDKNMLQKPGRTNEKAKKQSKPTKKQAKRKLGNKADEKFDSLVKKHKEQLYQSISSAQDAPRTRWFDV